MKIKLTENELKQIVAESVKKVLKENENNYDPHYEELIKHEMHRLYDLEGKVPQSFRPEIHHMVVTMEGILQDIQRGRDFDNGNN